MKICAQFKIDFKQSIVDNVYQSFLEDKELCLVNKENKNVLFSFIKNEKDIFLINAYFDNQKNYLKDSNTQKMLKNMKWIMPKLRKMVFDSQQKIQVLQNLIKF